MTLRNSLVFQMEELSVFRGVRAELDADPGRALPSLHSPRQDLRSVLYQALRNQFNSPHSRRFTECQNAHLVISGKPGLLISSGCGAANSPSALAGNRHLLAAEKQVGLCHSATRSHSGLSRAAGNSAPPPGSPVNHRHVSPD